MSTTAIDPLPCDIYARQSQGSDRSTDEQLDLGRARAEAEGWPVHAEYTDPVSASRHAAKARKDWPRLLADIQHDRARVVWLWESSRGDRRASTWLAFLEDCRDRRVRIYVETHGRLYDMANPRDWRVLAEDGTDNEYESEKTALRVRRALAANAADGKVHGKVTYGYRRIWELSARGKRVLVRQEPDPEHAPVVRWIFEQIAAGESLRAIAARLNADGVPTPGRALGRQRAAERWGTSTVRDIALNLAYIGKRVHDPEGSKHGRRVPGPDAGVYDAEWPALVDETTFYAARRVLLDPKRTTTRPGRARHLLSLIARCGVCGGPLTVAYPKNTGRVPVYNCRDRNCVSIDQATLDEHVTVKLLAWLAKEPNWERLTAAGPSQDAELEQARAALAGLETDYDETVALFQARKISPAAFAAVEPGKLADLEAARNRVAELETPPELAWLRGGPAEDVAARWLDAPLPAQRATIRALADVTVGRSPVPGHRVEAARRTVVEWTHGEPLASSGVQVTSLPA